MYPVSEKYIELMDQDIIDAQISLTMDLIRLDMDMQTGYSVTGIDSVDYGAMLEVTDQPPVKKASLERDYMRADGSYSLADVPYYIGAAMSVETPDVDGVYSIASSGVVLTRGWIAFSPAELTIVTEPAVAQIKVVQGSYYSVAASVDGVFRFSSLPGDSSADITVTVLSMRGPRRRAHLYRIYMGAYEAYGRGDILSANCVDINDGICLELPQKTISVSVNNLDGRYDPETEYTTPTFRRFHTQALIQMYVGTELCGVGRWFLDTYTVDDSAVTFNFVGPLAVMNEYTHLWSAPDVQYMAQRVKEIVNPGLELLDIASDKTIKSGAELYGINASCGDWVWAYKIASPLPPVPGAQALQLLCNYANCCILQGRTWNDPNNASDTADIHVVGMGWIGGQRQIHRRYQYGVPQWQVTDAVGLIRADVYSTSSDTTEETLADQVRMSVGYDTAMTADQLLGSVTVPEEVEGGGYGYASRTAAYAYAWYYTAKEQSYYTPQPVKAQVYKSIKTPATAAYGDGTEKTLSNPLLCNRPEGSSEITVEDYISRMYNELKHNLTATISHRGYPEIDAGEYVYLQTKPDGEHVKCRVLENRWSLTAGALKGTTKVRRME